MIYIFIFLLLFGTTASSQDCTTENVHRKPGLWKAGMKGSEGGTAAELAKEKALVDRLHKMFQSNFKPVGVECIYSGAYESARGSQRSNSFKYSIYPMPYYCENNRLKTAHETSSYFSISANSFMSDIYGLPEDESGTGPGFHYITDMPLEKDGYWVFPQRDVGLGLGITGRSQSWLVTYGGGLPFAYVTKKEFLEKRKEMLARQKQLAGNGFREVLHRIEIEKGFKEKEFRNDPQKMAHYLKMDYQSTKDRYEKLVKEQNQNFQPAWDKIEAQLKLPAAELNQPAIIKIDPKDHLSYLFTDDADPFGQVLIKPNAVYFNARLPRSSPQFFLITMWGDHNDPVSKAVMEGFRGAIDFLWLRSLLGK